MYGLTEMDDRDKNDKSDENECMNSKTKLNCYNSNDSFRNNLKKLLHSYRFHLIIVGLVILDCIIVVIELLIDLQIYTNESKLNQNERNEHNVHNNSAHSERNDHSPTHSTAHTVAEVLHYFSIAILCLFTTEVFLKIYAFRTEFFSHLAEVFDAFVILTSLILDIVFLNHEDVLRFIGLVIVLRLWRVVRVIHGIILSVKTPIEHSLEKEKKIRNKVEKELAELHLYVNSLEIEITRLRELLTKNGVINDIPPTYLRLDRKI